MTTALDRIRAAADTGTATDTLASDLRDLTNGTALGDLTAAVEELADHLAEADAAVEEAMVKDSGDDQAQEDLRAALGAVLADLDLVRSSVQVAHEGGLL